MFKRVEKRQRKRLKDEELGLDGDLKQVLGLQDTDTDESLDSSSDSESELDSGLDPTSGEDLDDTNEAHTGRGKIMLLKRKRPPQSFDSPSDTDGVLDEDQLLDPQPSDDDSQIDKEDVDPPPMGIMAASINPIYDLPGAPQTLDLRACILCPGKLLKNTKMTEMHLESTAHRRRFQRYTTEISRLNSSTDGIITDDPRDILARMSGSICSQVTDQTDVSKRSQRRTQWKAKRIERKKARKEKRAKVAAVKGEEDKGTAADVKKPLKRQVLKDSITTEAPSLSPVSDRKGSRGTLITARKVAQPKSQSARPSKRRKQEAEVDAETSSLGDLQVGSLSKPAWKKKDGRSQGERHPGAPTLKRHDTSLYFADDEQPQSVALPLHLTRSGTSGKHDCHPKPKPGHRSRQSDTSILSPVLAVKQHKVAKLRGDRKGVRKLPGSKGKD